jgi:hypothetical protein
MQTSVSEVAQLREQIAAEYLAAKLGLEGLNTGTAHHAFITARQERIGDLHGELRELVGDEAIPMREAGGRRSIFATCSVSHSGL